MLLAEIRDKREISDAARDKLSAAIAAFAKGFV